LRYVLVFGRNLMGTYVVVFVGGGIGSMARLFIISLMGKQVGTAFPWGTLAVNLLGALVIGLLIELMALRWSASESQRYFLVTGFLGGFTTFSAFSLETASMCIRGDWGMVAAYALASVLGTLGLVILSTHLLRAFL
jgi:fluoride exporter